MQNIIILTDFFLPSVSSTYLLYTLFQSPCDTDIALCIAAVNYNSEVRYGSAGRTELRDDDPWAIFRSPD